MASTREPLTSDRGSSGHTTDDYFPDADNYLYVQIEKRKKMKRWFVILFWIFAFCLLTSSIVVLTLLLLRVGGESPKVDTQCGKVEGNYDFSKDVYTFKGIPYAQPPVGNLRWQPPKEMSHKDGSCWTDDIKPAKDYRNECAQKDPAYGQFSGSENCLFLDIYTPSIEIDANLPVMVFFHGGYLRFGNGTWYGASPNEDSTRKLNAVFVSVQYRLNMFGFLVLDALHNRQANYGLRDQILSLDWVKKNIQGFGGNPNDVTIFGSSSGGSSVLLLAVSPMAQGLFHKVWSMSGSSVIDQTAQQAADQNAFFINKTDCFRDTDKEIADCLYSLDAETIVKNAYPEWGYSDSMDLPTKDRFERPIPVIDGEVLTHGLKEAFEVNATGVSNVPIMIGTTAQEIDLQPDVGYERMLNWETNENLYNTYLAAHLNPFGGNITKQAKLFYPYELGPEYSFTSMASDIRTNCPNDEIAAAASKSVKAGVYRYVITSTPSSPVYGFNVPFPANYSFHSWDMFGFFDVFDVWMPKGPKDSDKSFGKHIQNEIMTFVRTGKPKSGDWKPYPKSTALINSTTTVVPRYNKEQCEFWIGNGFFPYGWMN